MARPHRLPEDVRFEAQRQKAREQLVRLLSEREEYEKVLATLNKQISETLTEAKG